MKITKAFIGLSWVILTIFLVHGSAGAIIIDVSGGGNALQTAINGANPGDDVRVMDSLTYNEIVMKNGVDVITSVSATPTINCTTTLTSTVTFENGPINCNLDGFIITHSERRGAGILLDGIIGTVTTTISNCIIHNIVASGGIRMNGVVNCTIEDNTIYDCRKSGIAVGDPIDPDDVSDGSSITIRRNTIGDATNSNQESGIYLKGPPTGTVTVVIGGVGDANTIKYNAEAGIRLERIDNLTIDSNTINNNTESGILLRDVGSGSGNAIVQNNTINNNGKGGINIGGLSYLTIGSNNNIHTNSEGGMGFNVGSVVRYDTDYPRNASSGPVTITGNNIYDNTKGGIGIREAISNTVTITQNNIYSNDRGGIGIEDSCTLVITNNTIRDNIRGGIHTGTDVVDPGGFSGTAGSADLTIMQNKVYGNGESSYGAGIDVRHADGTINNNLVYENHRGGIRFGDWIDEIINNTVADNGNATDDMGGGIVYDDITAGDAVNAVPTGNPPAALDIRNNICAYNQKAGMKACFTNTPGSEERDYNLVYSNNGKGTDDCGWYSILGVSYVDDLRCANMQFGGCGAHTPSPLAMDGPHDIIADPLFVDRGADDYHLQSIADGYPEDSPAIDAGDTTYGTDVSLPPGEGTSVIDMGAYGGPDGINW